MSGFGFQVVGVCWGFRKDLVALSFDALTKSGKASWLDGDSLCFARGDGVMVQEEPGLTIATAVYNSLPREGAPQRRVEAWAS